MAETWNLSGISRRACKPDSPSGSLRDNKVVQKQDDCWSDCYRLVSRPRRRLPQDKTAQICKWTRVSWVMQWMKELLQILMRGRPLTMFCAAGAILIFSPGGGVFLFEKAASMFQLWGVEGSKRPQTGVMTLTLSAVKNVSCVGRWASFYNNVAISVEKQVRVWKIFLKSLWTFHPLGSMNSQT